MSQWKVECDVLDDGGLIVCFDPQLPDSTGTLVTAPVRVRYTSEEAVLLARRILAASDKRGRLP